MAEGIRLAQQDFHQKYGKFTKVIAAPDTLPTAVQLFARAQRAKESTSGGADGWRPRELKVLPLQAWKYRAMIVELYMELGRYPTGYHTVYIPSICKKDKGTEPLDSRLLTLFSTLYGIESGARFEILVPWLQTVLNPKVVGATPGLEGLDIAWDAQGDLEEALTKGLARVLSS